MTKKNKGQHGGPRPGSGRKPKPEAERRNRVYSVKLTADDFQLLKDTDARSWAREALLKEAKRRRKSKPNVTAGRKRGKKK